MKLKDVEIVVMSDEEYGEHLNQLFEILTKIIVPCSYIKRIIVMGPRRFELRIPAV